MLKIKIAHPSTDLGFFLIFRFFYSKYSKKYYPHHIIKEHYFEIMEIVLDTSHISQQL